MDVIVIVCITLQKMVECDIEIVVNIIRRVLQTKSNEMEEHCYGKRISEF